ncbi:MAG: flagellar biosynthesis protein FliQ [Chloroflexi bacterium]|nr:flagellar biosynthesis protein FliQ [Chloroflexota bacterium]
MTEATVMDLANGALTVALMLGAPLLIVTLVTGLIVSVFQATTQIHELTLTFVPKIAAVVIVLVVAGPWMLSTMLSYTTNIFQSLAAFGH